MGKAIYSRGTREQVALHLRWYALIISLLIRGELQLSFYVNETASPVHGRPCIEQENGNIA